MYPVVGQAGTSSTIGAGIGGGTTTGAGATTTGAGTGIPRLKPILTPAFAVVITRAVRARIAMFFFIILCWLDVPKGKSLVINRFPFCNLTGFASRFASVRTIWPSPN